MSDWVVPAPLAQPAPRKVGMTGLWVGMMWLVGVLFSLPVVMLGAGILGEEYQLKTLETRGKDISGTVVALQPAVTGRGRGNHGPLVDYLYEPKELAGKPDHIIHGERVATPSQYRILRTGGTVPLVYDPKRPEEAELASRVEAYRLGKDTSGVPRSPLFIAVIPVGFLSFLLWHHLRERQLLRWGKAAQASIIGEVEYNSRGRWSKVLYTFEDERGSTVHGEKAGLARANDPRPDFIEYRQRYLANPTAIYDPRNSARHMLYPGGTAKLIP